MHHSGSLPLTFKGPEQGFEGKNCQNVSVEKPFSMIRIHLNYILYCLQLLVLTGEDAMCATRISSRTVLIGLITEHSTWISVVKV